MAITLDSVIIRNEDVIFRKIEDEYVLVPMIASSDEVEHIYNLNKVGADVWERINGKLTVGDIINDLISEYEATPEQITKDVLDFLNDIYGSKIVRLNNEGS